MGNIAIVAVHYRLPVSRLVEFLGWNAAIVEDLHARVYIVSEQSYPLAYASSLVFPIDLKMFSISQTANFGIRRAIDDGAGVVLKTDIDCILDSLPDLAGTADGLGTWAPYRMVATPDDAGKIWTNGRGTIALTAGDWQRLNGYDERLCGYGADDGDLWARARRAGIRWRQCPPIRHVSATGEKFVSSGARRDYWRRGDGNPLNHAANRAAMRVPWARADWGKF